MKSSHGTRRSRRDSGAVDRRGLIRGGVVGIVGLVFGFLGVQRTDANIRNSQVKIPILRIMLENFLTIDGVPAAFTKIKNTVRLRPGEVARFWVSCIEDRPDEINFGRRYWRIAVVYCSPDGRKSCSFEEMSFFSPEV
jgi:hypothetical protein